MVMEGSEESAVARDAGGYPSTGGRGLTIARRFVPDGADPYEDDQLGGLRLSREGLRRRDRMVFEAARASNVPIVVVLAGGYARSVDDTVAIHVATIEEADKASTETRKHEQD